MPASIHARRFKVDPARVRAWRKRAGLTREALAVCSGLSTRTLGHAESDGLLSELTFRKLHAIIGDALLVEESA